MFLKLAALLLVTCESLADIPPLYRSRPYDLGAFDRWPHQLYHSSNAIGPILNIHEESVQCYNESIYTVVPYWGKQVNIPGVMLLDTKGYLVWHSTGYVTADVQSFRGEDYIVSLSIDSSYYALINSRYEEVYQIRSGNGWQLDAHELTLSPSGTALLVINGVFAVNQTTFEAPPEVEFILDAGFQEIEVQTGEVLFEWRASDHYTFEEYYHFQPGDGKSEKTAPDLFHVNSIEKDDLGNYLISCRMMSSIVYVDGRTGAVIWKLGGKGNMFKDLSGGAATAFNGQHHARFHENGRIVSIFDNGNCPGRPVTGPTRGLTVVLDTEKMTVQLQHEYISPNNVLTDNSGSMQILDSGNVVLGFGPNANWAEYASNGSLLCNVHMGPETFFNSGEIRSYRISKSPWVGHPQTMPEIAVDDARVYVSWNGATEVSMWSLNGTDIEGVGGESVCLGRFPKDGFETEMPVPTNPTGRYLFVSALDRAGQVLGSTSTVQWPSKPRQGIVHQGL
ncbi:hypothetical protein N7536_008473 [Penicillium majusculum]|uniref:ASST-domain-containing protein n=1 Tax=Penicillium solitum TaxID=60172 RepID=A0A1V6R8L2_9EURO|nr:uncharacterized protein PENSOL_c011G10781 [Penicillium solitum]KAJ5685854.1 hypothetical protein N7536_008473 [Penicillium majusculum]OQD97601.1 hypothetical protein PENSOL_c011G10781 [Penicillium solitum]